MNDRGQEARDENVRIFNRVIEEGFNSGNLAQLDALFHPSFVEHQAGFPTPDLEGLKRGITSLRRAIPDIRLRIVDTIAERDKICFLLSGTGTHLGSFGPLPGTGTALTLNVIDICRFEDGVIIEHWGIPDRMGIMEQIGMPQPPRWLMNLMMRRRRRSAA
ncbi:MAG: ester cyclase [Acidimicrobiia bacterium]